MDETRLREAFRERPLSEVIDTLLEVEALRRAVHATELEAIADIDAREGWRADGCASMADWLCFRLAMSRKTAHEFLEAARATGDLPHLSGAFSSGELSWDKTKAVAVVATPDCDELLVAEAKETDVGHLERAARRARAVTLQEANERHAARFLALRRSVTLGGVRLHGFLPDVDGETVVRAIERLADDVPKDPDTGLYPSFDERCADALVDMASGYLASEQPVHGERAMVVAHVDLSQVAGEGLHAETASGMTLAPETVAHMMCDCVIEPVFEAEGRTIGIGRKDRRPPQWLRRRLVHRDVTCRFPGCSRMRVLQEHHVEHWPAGGPTETHNLVTLCRYHHRLAHQGGWSIRGNPDASLEFVKPNGKVLVSEPPKLSPEVRKRLLRPVLPDG